MILWVLIGLNALVWLVHIVVFGVDVSNPKPLDLLVLGGSLLESTIKQPWRLLTSTFMHAGFAHLAFNMIGLLQLGTIAIRFYGSQGMAVVYFVSAIGGAIASLRFGAANSVSVGASGAIFGLLGAIVASAISKRKALGPEQAKGFMVMGAVFVLYSLFTGFTQPGIDNAAHAGGLVAGALVAMGLAEKFDSREFATQATKRLALTLLGSLVVLYALWSVVTG